MLSYTNNNDIIISILLSVVVLVVVVVVVVVEVVVVPWCWHSCHWSMWPLGGSMYIIISDGSIVINLVLTQLSLEHVATRR